MDSSNRRMWRRRARGRLQVTHPASRRAHSCLPRPLHRHVSPCLLVACPCHATVPARLWHPRQGRPAAGQQGAPGGEANTGAQALTPALPLPLAMLLALAMSHDLALTRVQTLPQGLALTRVRALSSGLPPLQFVIFR